MLFLDLIQEGNLGLHQSGREVPIHRKGYKIQHLCYVVDSAKAITRSIADQAPDNSDSGAHGGNH